MTRVALTSAQLADCVRAVCELEVRAFKPGNVSVHSPGHGMTAELFVASAAAMAQPLCRDGATVGERIHDAVAATRAVAGCNTNLGIVLLLAPLVHAAQGDFAGDLRSRVRAVLGALTVDDAAQAYAAIRIAAPGGLGNSARHDVSEQPQVNLLAAMREAAAVDRIACEYAEGFAGIFDFGLPLAAASLHGGAGDEAAAVAVFLGWMARQPDTHVARKFGLPLAEAVQAEAAAVRDAYAKMLYSSPAAATLPLLSRFDVALKDRGINPGTSADLTVASLVALHLQTALGLVANDRPAQVAGGYHPPRASARVFHQPV